MHGHRGSADRDIFGHWTARGVGADADGAGEAEDAIEADELRRGGGVEGIHRGVRHRIPVEDKAQVRADHAQAHAFIRRAEEEVDALSAHENIGDAHVLDPGEAQITGDRGETGRAGQSQHQVVPEELGQGSFDGVEEDGHRHRVDGHGFIHG